MAATLAYLIVDQRDSAGVGIFDGELRNYVEPKSTLGILADISRELEKVDPDPVRILPRFFMNLRGA